MCIHFQELFQILFQVFTNSKESYLTLTVTGYDGLKNQVLTKADTLRLRVVFLELNIRFFFMWNILLKSKYQPPCGRIRLHTVFGLELDGVTISNRPLRGKLRLVLTLYLVRKPLCFKGSSNKDYQYSQSEISPALCRHLTLPSLGFHQYYQLCLQKSVILPQIDQRPRVQK